MLVSLFGGLCELHAASLTAAAGLNLSLNDGQAANFLSCCLCFFRGGRNNALEHGYTVLCEELARLVFEKVHRCPSSSKWCRVLVHSAWSLEVSSPVCPVRAIGISRTRRTRIIDAGNFSRLYSIGFGVSSHSRTPKSEILATQLTNILGRFHPKGVHRVTNPSYHSPLRREIPAKKRRLPPCSAKPRSPSQQADNTPGTARRVGRAPPGTRPSIGVVRLSPLTR